LRQPVELIFDLKRYEKMGIINLTSLNNNLSTYLQKQTESNFGIVNSQLRIHDLIYIPFHLWNEYENNLSKLDTGDFKSGIECKSYPNKANLPVLSDLINYSWMQPKSSFVNNGHLITGIYGKSLSQKLVPLLSEDKFPIRYSIILDVLRSYQNSTSTSQTFYYHSSEIQETRSSSSNLKLYKTGETSKSAGMNSKKTVFVVLEENKLVNKEENETEAENYGQVWKIEKPPKTGFKYLFAKKMDPFSHQIPLSQTSFENLPPSGNSQESVPDTRNSLSLSLNLSILGKKHGNLIEKALNPKYSPLKNIDLEYAGLWHEDSVAGQVEMKDTRSVSIENRQGMILKRPAVHVSTETSKSAEKSLSEYTSREISSLSHEKSNFSVISSGQINSIVDRVYKLLEAKLSIEKERRGLR
jgi:hypothetical protein